MYYLDLVISGRDIADIEVNAEWIAIIKHLFGKKISENPQIISKYDDYIFSTFECFIKQKDELRFDMYWLSVCDTDFVNLIMNELIKIDARQDIATMKVVVNGEDDTNLPKKEVLSIFENVQILELDLFDPDYLYIISLSSLLSIIISHPSMEMVRILLGHHTYNHKLRSLYSLSMEMKIKYENVGYTIDLKEEQQYIVCVIKRNV